MWRRPATDDDRGYLTEVFLAGVGHLTALPEPVRSQVIAHQQDAREHGWGAQWPDLRHDVLLDASGHRCGVLRTAEQGPCLVVVDLAVHPQARRRGHAAGALAHLQALVACLHLQVAVDNLPARSLYAACGFTDDGGTPVYRRLVWHRSG